MKKREFEDFELAEEAAKKFLTYAERRSIYFDNNFTHKTFLEYYTADFIFIKFHNRNKYVDRDKIISQYLANPFWSVVFELLLAKIDKDQEDNDILDNLVSKQLKGNSPNKLYFLLLQVPRIKYISAKIKSDIIERGVVFALKGNNAVKRTTKGTIYEGTWIFALKKLLYDSKSFDLFQKVVLKLEESFIEEETQILLYKFVAEITGNLNEKASALAIKNEARLLELAQKDQLLFLKFVVKKAPITEYAAVLIRNIHLFGLEATCSLIRHHFYDFTWTVGAYQGYLATLASRGDVKQFIGDYYLLEAHGLSLEWLLKEKGKVRLAVFITPPSALNLVRMYLQCSDTKVEGLLLHILSQANNIKSYYGRVRAEIKNPKKLKVLDQLFSDRAPKRAKVKK